MLVQARFLAGFVFLISLFYSQWLVAQDAVPGEFIVVYKPNSQSETSSKVLAKTALNHNLSLKTSWPRLNIYHFKVRAKSGDDQKILEELKKDPSVLAAEPNYLVRAMSLVEGQATYRSSTDQDIQIQSAWKSVHDSQDEKYTSVSESYSPIVAVIDSGVDIEHEVFKDHNRIWVNQLEANGQPGVDDDQNGYIDDINGWNFVNNNNDVTDIDNRSHGTHVAGIVASSVGPLPSRPALNFLPQVKIMPIKFLKDGVGKTSHAISAINYAIKNGARVLNNSWGGYTCSEALYWAIVYAYQQKVTFVASAGNSSLNTDTIPIYPASLNVPNVISVGASQKIQRIPSSFEISRASFSNYGHESVHIFAPGHRIYSTIRNNAYKSLEGTSMAAPYVSALSALMLIEAPQFSGYQIKKDILSSGDVFSSLTGISESDARINFNAAISEVQSHSDDAIEWAEYTPSFSCGNKAFENGGTGCGRVKNIKRLDDAKNKAPMVLFLVLCPLFLLLFYRKKISSI